MRRDLISRAVKMLSGEQLQLLRECLDHAMTKPHLPLAPLVPILINGHHQIDEANGRGIKSAIRNLSSEELSWLADNIETFLPE